MNLDKAFEFAQATAHAAGALLRDYYQRGVTAEYKGEIDLVTEADRESERLILDRIRAAYPDHAILAEESGADMQVSPYRWIVDPLDGTTNFAHGFPAFSVTMALLVDARSSAALPTRNTACDCSRKSANCRVLLSGFVRRS
jgi:myo-inositol-1(or 4)-monophosphatase